MDGTDKTGRDQPETAQASPDLDALEAFVGWRLRFRAVISRVSRVT
jgi:hypothetical protein